MFSCAITENLSADTLQAPSLSQWSGLLFRVLRHVLATDAAQAADMVSAEEGIFPDHQSDILSEEHFFVASLEKNSQLSLWCFFFVGDH